MTWTRGAGIGSIHSVSSAPAVLRRSFEGLFRYGLVPTGAFLEDLKAVGYDPEHPQDTYSTEVWRSAIEVARRHCFAELPPDEGLRRVGQAFVAGFAQTVVGRVFALTAPLLSPERCLTRLPNVLKTARSDAAFEVTALEERHWRLTYRGELPVAHFVRGGVEVILRLTRIEPRVEIVDQDSTRIVFEITW